MHNQQLQIRHCLEHNQTRVCRNQKRTKTMHHHRPKSNSSTKFVQITNSAQIECNSNDSWLNCNRLVGQKQHILTHTNSRTTGARVARGLVLVAAATLLALLIAGDNAIAPASALEPQQQQQQQQPNSANAHLQAPVVINRQAELQVGSGSNVTLACSVKGSPPLSFTWYQDEKNLTVKPQNASQPPSTTKVLEERRYEIAEELTYPNITTSLLYLYNLQPTDTSLFLCWVTNEVGYTITNFSLTVDDTWPATNFASPLENNAHQAVGDHGKTLNGMLSRSLNISPGGAQIGLLLFSLVIILVLVAGLLFLVSRRRNNYTDDLEASDAKQQTANMVGAGHHNKGDSGLSSRNKLVGSANGMALYEQQQQQQQRRQRSMLTDSENDEDVEYDDGRSTLSDSSATSECDEETTASASSYENHEGHKQYHQPHEQHQHHNQQHNNHNQHHHHHHHRLVSAASGDLNGFIEHLRSGIINIDYHSMSPVIQFNQQQQLQLQQQQQQQQSNTLTKQINANTQPKSSVHSSHVDVNHQQAQALSHFGGAGQRAAPGNNSQPRQIAYAPTQQQQQQQRGVIVQPAARTSLTNTNSSINTLTSDLSPSTTSTVSAQMSPAAAAAAHQLMLQRQQHQLLLQRQQQQQQHLQQQNCDFDEQQQQHRLSQLMVDAPATNTTTASYSSDYTSGYSASVEPLDPSPSAMQPQQHQAHMYYAHSGVAPPVALVQQQQQQQQVMPPQFVAAQGHMQQQHNGNQIDPDQRHVRYDSGFHVL